MEDLDPPREQPGAAASILKSLAAHHLFWDQPVLYQSRRLEAYRAALNTLKPFLYHCDCTRQRIAALGGRYDGHCRRHPPAGGKVTAIRIRADAFNAPAESLFNPGQTTVVEHFHDLFLGPQTMPLSATGDFIVQRKDGLFAYQLAVVVDDHCQGITHVVRGADLLDSTGRQRYLLSLLHGNLPEYGHIPLALGEDGHKLSKQTQATPLNDQQAVSNLIAALRFLQHEPPPDVIATHNCSELLRWASHAWQRSRIPHNAAIAPTLIDA